MRDRDKTVQQKAQGVHLKVPTSTFLKEKKKKKEKMQINTVTICAEMTTKPAAQLNYH